MSGGRSNTGSFSRRSIHGWVLRGGLLALLVATNAVRAETIPLPNASFESPQTIFVDVNIDAWQKTPKPAWFDESGGFMWSQLTGTFKNTTPGSSNHIDNCEGAQAIWLFAVPDVGLFQDYNSVDWNDVEPTHAFEARFDVSKAYRLTAGVIGGGGGMSNGVTLELSLYYRDAASNRVTVAATTVTNTPGEFGNRTHLLDFQVSVPTVQSNDPWAGQYIGVSLLSTVGIELRGGYWDLDNLRLESIREPVLLNPVWLDGHLAFNLQSEPGTVLQVLASSELALPASAWPVLATVTNRTGLMEFTDTGAIGEHGFFRLREVP